VKYQVINFLKVSNLLKDQASIINHGRLWITLEEIMRRQNKKGK